MRNRYLDLLRAAAIVRVIVYHLFGWPWLSIVLPAMGIMFALAGSLTAASLDRRSASRVVTSRLRRLLPPLWLLGLIVVPVMLVLGWRQETGGEVAFSPAKLLLWILPIGDPPGSDKAVDAWEPLWYIRAYLWFVVLSPVMYLAYRKTGWVAVAAPIALIAVLDRTGFGLPDVADAAMWDFVTFGGCWMAGFAHHDGRLARTRPWLVIGAALVLGGVAMFWLKFHPGEDGYDLNDVTESQALWSLAFVLIVLRWQPPMGWLARVRPLDAVVTLLNGRAVTIYLWHNIAVASIWPVLSVVALDDLGRLDGPVDMLTALVLTGIAVLLFGWAEDLAARRRPRLWPIVDTPRLSPAGVAADAPDSPLIHGATGARQPTAARRSRATDGMPHQRSATPPAQRHAGAAALSALYEPTQVQPALYEATQVQPALYEATQVQPALYEATRVQPALAGPAHVAPRMTAERPVVQFGLPPDATTPAETEQPQTPRPEPARPEPMPPESVRPEPARPEPMRPESVRPEPARPEPMRPEPVRPEPVRPEPVPPEPVPPEPVRAEAVRAEAVRAEAVRAEAVRARSAAAEGVADDAGDAGRDGLEGPAAGGASAVTWFGDDAEGR